MFSGGYYAASRSNSAERAVRALTPWRGLAAVSTLDPIIEHYGGVASKYRVINGVAGPLGTLFSVVPFRYNIYHGNKKAAAWNAADGDMGVVSVPMPLVGLSYFGLRVVSEFVTPGSQAALQKMNSVVPSYPF